MIRMGRLFVVDIYGNEFAFAPNRFAGCPNDHRKAHYGKHSIEIEWELIKIIPFPKIQNNKVVVNVF